MRETHKCLRRVLALHNILTQSALVRVTHKCELIIIWHPNPREHMRQIIKRAVCLVAQLLLDISVEDHFAISQHKAIHKGCVGMVGPADQMREKKSAFAPLFFLFPHGRGG